MTESKKIAVVAVGVPVGLPPARGPPRRELVGEDQGRRAGRQLGRRRARSAEEEEGAGGQQQATGCEGSYGVSRDVHVNLPHQSLITGVLVGVLVAAGVLVAVGVGVAFPRFRVDQSIRFFFKIPTLVGIFSIIYVQMMFTS